MKKLFNVSSLIISSVLFGGIQIASASSLKCEEFKGCERKFCEIEKQITIAKSKGNTDKVEGLQIALKESKSTCSNESLIEDLTSEMSEVKEKILEYEDDLKEAKDDEKPEKIKKYTDKIAEEKNKLKQLEAELKELQ